MSIFASWLGEVSAGKTRKPDIREKGSRLLEHRVQQLPIGCLIKTCIVTEQKQFLKYLLIAKALACNKEHSFQSDVQCG